MSLRRPLALLAVAALVLAACGGDDGDEAAEEATTTVAADDEAPTTTEGAAEPTTTTEDAAEPTTTEDDGTPAGGIGDVDFAQFDDICELADAGEAVGATAFDEVDPTLTAPEDLEAVFTAADDFIARAAEIAPDEIADDFQVVSEAFGGLIDVLAEFDYDFFALALQAENDPELISQLEALDDPRLQEATDDIDAYFREECGIEPTDTTAG
jgi:ABC-type glycerol-3-phosphate transport system substrate-binding protein